MESILFHADPHPGNVLLQPGNRIVFIDFGSCGRFSSKTKTAWKTMHAYLRQEDVQGMVRASISILEPLPHIDLESFSKEVEGLFWDWLYAIKDDHSEWWEKASGTLWMRFVSLVRRYEVPMNLETLRLFRATFLYDTTVYRLCREVKADDEYGRWFKRAGRRAERRLRKQLRRRLRRGLMPEDYLRIEDMMRLGQQMVERVQNELDRPRHQFQQMLGKVGFIASFLLKVSSYLLGLHALVVTWLYVRGIMTGVRVDLWQAFRQTISTEGYQIALAIFGVLLIRRLSKRLQDVDIDR
jgi:predicted unusual protein kinase regulating ubiquinone biosynthesis (AarF/ABC1/UbiB family)